MKMTVKVKGRPPSGNERNLSDSLLVAAKIRLHEKSHLDLTSREIAETAGTHAGMVNYYFQSKDQLLLTLLDNLAKDIGQHLDALESRIESSNDDPTEHIVRELIDAYYPNTEVCSVFYIEMFRATKAFRMFYSQSRDFTFDRIEKLIRKLIAKGIYRPGLDAITATWMLLSLVQGPLIAIPICQARDPSAVPPLRPKGGSRISYACYARICSRMLRRVR